jgi:hypothetical protein
MCTAAKEVDGVSIAIQLKLLCKIDREHCLALARATVDPQKARIISQPKLILLVLLHPLACTLDSQAFAVDQTLTVNGGVCKEESFSAGRFRGFRFEDMVVLELEISNEEAPPPRFTDKCSKRLRNVPSRFRWLYSRNTGDLAGGTP